MCSVCIQSSCIDNGGGEFDMHKHTHRMRKSHKLFTKQLATNKIDSVVNSASIRVGIV